MSEKSTDLTEFGSIRRKLIEQSTASDVVVAGTVGTIVLRLIKEGEDISSERLISELRKAAEGSDNNPDVIRARAALQHLGC